SSAVLQTTVDEILKFRLGIGRGLEHEIQNKSLTEWLRVGAIREDDELRFLNHFHNPLNAWTVAGYVNVGQSSILWAQKAARSTPSWSWPDARRYYLEALTLPRASERDAALARTFRALGHVIHLVQDAAVPAHTRNDPHSAYNYERLVRDVQQSIDPREAAFFTSLLANPRMPDRGWKTLEA